MSRMQEDDSAQMEGWIREVSANGNGRISRLSIPQQTSEERMSDKTNPVRVHYSREPIKALGHYTNRLQLDVKPRGLWWSVDGDWERWCRAEDWTIGQHRNEIIADMSRILQLKTVSDIDLFHAEFTSANQLYIKWPVVAWEWAGIEIAPYQWDRRHNGHASRWYYGWDCASGCVWDVNAISLVQEGPPETHVS